MESVVKLEFIHLFSVFELMAASEPMIWFMYVIYVLINGREIT